MMRKTLSALLASSFLISGAALAEGVWTSGPASIDGSIRAGSREVPVKPGDTTRIAGTNLSPGQTVQVMRGTELLTPEPVTVAPDGSFSVDLAVPEDAGVGNHPLTVIAANPAATALIDLKLSEVVPLSGEDGFEIVTAPALERTYQTAPSDDGKLYVAAARGEAGPGLLRLDAATLAEEARAEMPTDAGGKPYGAFGIGVDDTHGHVWVTETQAETVLVFKADDLSVVKVFPEGTVGHPRDVAIDQTTGRAYVNDALTGRIHVFDTETLEELDPVHIHTADGREVFGTVSLDLDADRGRLYSVSRDTPWVGWVDLASGESHSFRVPAANGATGIAHDPESGRIFVASQNSDNLVVLDEAGEVIADTPIGAGGLSVAFEPVSKRVYAATRAGGTVAVLDVDGNLVANLPLGDAGNHVVGDGKGAVYAVAMYGARDDGDATGSVTRVTAR